MSSSYFRIGRVWVGWLDRWTGRSGLAIEITIRRRIYSIAFGFGDRVRVTRGWS